MEPQLGKKYGLSTAIAMVVGIVIGSGVFFKAEAVLASTGGDVGLGILAWVLVGLVMIVCANAFATLAGRYGQVGGVVDYAEVMVSPRYAYYLGWFMATVYYPTLAAVLAWASARYLCVLLGLDANGGGAMLLAALFLCLSFAVNTLTPLLAGRIQTWATLIKLIPLVLMAAAGTVGGLRSGLLVENFVHPPQGAGSGSLLSAVVSVAFAYDGWVIATSINAELRDAKRNLPLALTAGSLMIVAVYVFYYIGLTGAVTTGELMASGEAAARRAFSSVFGAGAGTAIFVLVVVSCLGALNGMTLANCRGMYALAARGEVSPIFGSVDPVTHMPMGSSVLGLLLACLWLLHYYGGRLAQPGWFGPFGYDTSELPVITVYVLYIPIFLMTMVRERDLRPFRRFVLPLLALAGCVFMAAASVLAHRGEVLPYLAVSSAIMAIGAIQLRRRQ